MSLFFGPCTPYQFRLHGPGSKENTRDLIMTQWDRFAAPMKTRPVTDNNSIPYLKVILLVIIIAWMLKWLFL